MDSSSMFDKAFWAFALSIVTLGVKFLREMAGSIGHLNEKMAVVIERMDSYRGRIEALEEKIKK